MGGILRRCPVLAAGLAWVLALVGGATAVGAPATPVATPQPEVTALLAKAAATMEAVTTYRFKLTYEEGTTTIYGRITIQKADGEVQRPDRFKATVDAKLGPLTVGVAITSVGDQVWVEVAGVNSEVNINEDVARILFDPTAILIGALETINQPVIVGEKQIGGVTVTRVAGTVDPAQLVHDTTSSLVTNSASLPVELAIADDGHVVSLRLDGPLIRADSDDVVRRLDLSEFDQPVEIEPPGG